MTQREMINEIKNEIIKAGKDNPTLGYKEEYDIEYGDYSIMYYCFSGSLEFFNNYNGKKWVSAFRVSKRLVEFIYEQIKEKGIK